MMKLKKIIIQIHLILMKIEKKIKNKKIIIIHKMSKQIMSKVKKKIEMNNLL